MDARVEQAAGSSAEHEPGVIAATAYAGSKRVANITVEDARTWSRRPGHMVWIGLHLVDGCQTDTRRLYTLRRASSACRNAALPLAEVCNRLEHADVMPIDKGMQPLFRET
jgi:hypothetical protein